MAILTRRIAPNPRTTPRPGGSLCRHRSGGVPAATPVAGFGEGVVVPEGRLELPTPRL